jgi:hypothetical protein
MKKARKTKKKKIKKDWGSIMGSVVLNKVNGLMSVHFYPQENMKIKKGEKLYLQGESYVRALSPERFFDNSIYRVAITEAYNLGKFKKKQAYLESKKK